jgi:hypothetical protein
MKSIMGTWDLYHALKAEGYDLPKECVTVTLGPMPPDDVMQLTFVCNVTTEDAKKLGRALICMAEKNEIKDEGSYGKWDPKSEQP